ncbi:transcriptional regulator [Fischerella thermalis CCMEE 5198]|jgi:predicted DNA-binding transcriptional regulator YafY|uniref:transcriptional regulator n=1 Tax=Fischerella TaxID=1190 RepID=UPI000C80B1F5|nr:MULTISPECIES: transcriptional regulator [Fischerella]PLZ93748.1 transcriptional regulator [Fischerella thermalis CCMEE 5196]PMB21869.1 transcriptional regulator [Fischerella thermalis CCMEE 5198]PMB48799.1 transcriptional regulator [Fischerella thermalis CCMEE 5201]
MPRKKETITLSIPPGTKEQLEAIARNLNIYWGKDPSISGLIVAIAQQSVEVGKPFTLDSNQVNALQQAIKALSDAGRIGEAQTVITLLLERGNLDAAIRQSLLKQASKLVQAWRRQIDEYRQNQQPFYLLYENSQGQELQYTVRYAEPRFFDKRFYLMIWCEETEDVENLIPDLPELWHNRSLIFDKIRSIVPASGEWREGLDYLKVYLQFRGWMVKSYQRREDDLEDEIIGDVRQVVRRVVNEFWLIREVARYWDECVIISPEPIRDRLKQKLLSLCILYDIEIRS